MTYRDIVTGTCFHAVGVLARQDIGRAAVYVVQQQ